MEWVSFGKARNEDVRCRFCGDGHLFWDCTFSHLVHVWELPEFMLLITRDRSTWPRCLLWHGWLPCLSTAGERDPSAACVGQLAHTSLEQIVGAYPSDASGFWTPPDFFLIGLEDHPSVWADDSREEYPIGGFDVAGWCKTGALCDFGVAGLLAWSSSIDGLNVVRSNGRPLDQDSLSKLLPWFKLGIDFDCHHMIRVRGPETVQVTKVKEHAMI